ncbi:hypothetical protein BDN71DRAFT_328677 [Pleurotus eryngii]|uniref:Uncharacterized protein n=1 Tax=Pleurotus eryngii TaxID=5323 RepID=A0A9P5ZJD3_PLEER|nr:hypothetical protein BDN71DRAFT_328677 [Pleurotus eryngii]
MPHRTSQGLGAGRERRQRMREKTLSSSVYDLQAAEISCKLSYFLNGGTFLIPRSTIVHFATTSLERSNFLFKTEPTATNFAQLHRYSGEEGGVRGSLAIAIRYKASGVHVKGGLQHDSAHPWECRRLDNRPHWLRWTYFVTRLVRAYTILSSGTSSQHC